MASSSKQVSLKLLIDSKNNKVLFAEAGKDFVDFLFTLLSLPIGSVIRLLTAKSMVGCLGNLYGSIENMNETYMQPNHNKEDLLKPKAVVTSKEVPLLLTDDISAVKKVYMCGSYHRFIADDPRAICPTCKYTISTEVPLVVPEVAKDGFSGEGGYVKGVVTYMAMDDLVVTPMSTISGIALLSKCNVTNVGALEEKVVNFGMDEGLKLLKGSLQSKAVLTSIFLDKKVSEGSSTKFTRRDEEILAQVMEQFGHARTYGLGGFFTDVLGGGYRQSQEQNRIFQAQLQDQFQLYQVQFETQMKDAMDTQTDAMLTETQSQAATIQALQSRMDRVELHLGIRVGPVAQKAAHKEPVHSQQNLDVYSTHLTTTRDHLPVPPQPQKNSHEFTASSITLVSIQRGVMKKKKGKYKKSR